MAIKPSKIQIVSEYTDLSTEKIKKGFSQSELAADRYAKAVEKMGNSSRRSSTKMRKEMVTALNDINNSLKKTHRASLQTADGHNRMRIATEDLRRRIGALRNNLLLVFFAYRLVIRPMKEWIDLMNRQQVATARLNTALESQGTFSERTSKRLIDMSEAFQKVTRFGDEAIQEVMQALIDIGGVVPSQLNRATQAVLDFSTKTGRDLRTSANVVAKAAAGYTGELSRYGIIIDRNIPKSEKFNKTLAFIEQRFGGAAQKDLEVFAGKVDHVSNRFGDLKESIGKIIVQKFRLDEVVKFWGDLIDAVTPADEAPKRIEVLTRALKDINGEIRRTNESIQTADPLSSMTGFDTRTSEDAFNQFKALLQRRKAIQKQIEEETTRTQKQAVVDRQKDISDLENEQRAKAQREFQTELDALRGADAKEELRMFEERFENYRKFIDDKIALDELYAKGRREIELKIFAQEKKETKGRIDLQRQFAEGSRKALEDGFFNILTGQFQKLTDVVRAFGEELLRAASRKLAERTLVSLGFSNILGLAIHQGGPIRGGMSASSGYDRTPRKSYHSGGEVDATLLDGEGVLNRRAMKRLGVDNLNKLNRGEGAGGGDTNITNNIYAIDERSFRDRLNENGDIFEGAVGLGISSNRKIRRTIQRHI